MTPDNPVAVTGLSGSSRQSDLLCFGVLFLASTSFLVFLAAAHTLYLLCISEAHSGALSGGQDTCA